MHQNRFVNRMILVMFMVTATRHNFRN
jgi:hypothetical protein